MTCVGLTAHHSSFMYMMILFGYVIEKYLNCLPTWSFPVPANADTCIMFGGVCLTLILRVIRASWWTCYVIYMQIRLVRSSPPSREFEQTSQQAYEVYRKYQMAVHGDAPDKCTPRQFSRFLVNSPLQVITACMMDPYCIELIEQQENQILHSNIWKSGGNKIDTCWLHGWSL